MGEIDKTEATNAQPRSPEPRLGSLFAAVRKADFELASKLESEVDVVLATIAEQARLMTGARCACVGLLAGGPAHDHFEHWVAAGVHDVARPAPAPQPAGLLGQVVAGNRSLRLGAKEHAAALRDVPARFPAVKAGFLGVPVSYGDRQIGALFLVDKQDGGEFDEDDAQIVELFAQSSGLAIDHARRYALVRTENEERQRVEKELLEAQRVAHVGSWVWDVVGGGLQWSEESYRIFGHRPGEDVTYESFLRLIHPDDLARVTTAVQDALEKQAPYDIEHRIVRFDGSERIVNERGMVHYDAARRPVRMIGTVHDITERKRSEAALRRSEAQFRRVIEDAPEGIFIHTQGRLLYANPAFRKALGYSDYAELAMRSVRDLVHPADRENVREREAGILASGQASTPGEIRLLRRDGSVWETESIGMSIEYDGRPCFLVFSRDITERKRAQAAQGQWEAIFNSTAWGVVMSDGRRLTAANPAFAAMHGFAVKEMIGMPVPDLFAPEERAGLNEIFRIIDSTGHHTFESVHLRKDGSRFPVLVDATSVTDSHGKFLYRAVYVQDITARKQAEDALRRSESNLARAQQLAKLGSWDWDLRTNRLEWSREMYRLYGLKEQEFEPVARSTLRYVHPADRDKLTRATENALKGAGSFAVDYRIRRPSGDQRILHSEGNVLYDETHQAMRMTGTVQDVTDARRAEMERENLIAKLDEERARLETVIDTSPVAIFVHQGEAKLTFNRRAAEWFGPISSDEGIAPFAIKMFRRDGRPFRKEELPAVRALRGEVVDAEEVLFREAHQERVFLVAASPIRDAAGKIIAAVTAVQDITAIKEYERLRDQWTAVIAHDLRQPLTAIAAYADLLALKYAADEKVGSQVTHIVESAGQMRRMISDLLDVTSIEAHHLTLERKPLDIKSFLAKVVERSTDFTKGNQIDVFIDSGVTKIEADPGRLEQVLNNLLSNAVKYGRHGGVIDVNVERVGGEVRFSVENEGEGIAPTELPHVFERFRRAAKDHGIKGLGLGLYIAKGLVESHGGRIWVESVPNQKTAFHFTIPA